MKKKFPESINVGQKCKLVFSEVVVKADSFSTRVGHQIGFRCRLKYISIYFGFTVVFCLSVRVCIELTSSLVS